MDKQKYQLVVGQLEVAEIANRYTIPGKGVAGSEAMGPGRRRGTRRPRAA